jgi:hypothetical protein
MAKNIPITAKVSKGLFGQKATEPVLNVGQAGAYGNNVTRGIAHSARKTKRSEIQLAKAQADLGYYKDEKGNKINITDKKSYISNAKKEARLAQTESKVAGYQGSRDAAIKQSQQSTRIHGTIKGVNLDPKGEQVLHASQVGSKGTSESDAKTQGRAIGGFDVSEAPKTQNTNPELTKNTSTGEAAGAAANTKRQKAR